MRFHIFWPSYTIKYKLIYPNHLLTGYLCERELKREPSFQCENKQCISEHLRCNDDHDCDDRSDEKNCRCPTTKFRCPTGECISPGKICDKKDDCSDNADESNCGMKVDAFLSLLCIYLSYFVLCCSSRTGAESYGLD